MILTEKKLLWFEKFGCELVKVGANLLNFRERTHGKGSKG